MPIKPFDAFARPLDKLRPSLHGQAELEVRRTSIGESEKDAPEHHADARVEEVQETYMCQLVPFISKRKQRSYTCWQDRILATKL